MKFRHFYLPFLTLFLLFFSCSNILSDAFTGNSNSENSKTIELSGNISYKGVASKLMQPAASNSARSALPGFDFNSSDYSYFVHANKKDAASSEPEITGTVNADEKTFKIALTAGYQWTVTVGIKKISSSTEKIVMSDTYTTGTLSPGDSVNHNFILEPKTEGSGSLNLAISVPSGVKTLKITFTGTNAAAQTANWNSALSSDTNSKADITGIRVSGLKSGVYNAVLSFLAEDGHEVFVSYQIFNIFDDLETDLWESSSGTASSTFSVSETMIAHYQDSNFYVGATAICDSPSDDNSGRAGESLATISKALELIESIGNINADYIIHVNGTINDNAVISTQKAASITIQKMTGSTEAVIDGDTDDDGMGNGSVFSVNTTLPVEIKDLTIQNGNASYGGGINIESGSLTLTACQIKTNNASISGGGVYISSEGSLTINGATITQNTATQNGSGIYSDGTLSLSNEILFPADSQGSNDIYLTEGKTVTVDAEIVIAASSVPLTPQSYYYETEILSGTEVSTQYTNFSVNNDRFGNEWNLDDEGKITVAPVTLKTGLAIKTIFTDELSANTTAISFERSLTAPSETETICYLDENESGVQVWYDSASTRLKYFITIPGYVEKNQKLILNSNSSYLFYGCEKLKQIDTSLFNTNAVTKMGYMFSGCKELQTLNLENFNTSNVTSMANMFENCESLESLDLSNFETSNVSDITVMFSGCKNLKNIDVSSFNIKKATSISNMFASCSSLTSIDLTSLDTSNISDFTSVFNGCENLTEIKIDKDKFSTAKAEFFTSMFNNCKKLPSLDLSNFNTEKASDFSYMFYGCESFTELDISNFDFSAATKTESMFSGCTKLNTIYAAENTALPSSIASSYMFSNCTNLKGDMGTEFASTQTTATYARIDNTDDSEPGYFSVKGRIVLKTGIALNTVISTWNAAKSFGPSSEAPDAGTTIKFLDLANETVPVWYDTSDHGIKFYAEGITDGGGKKLKLRKDSSKIFKDSNYLEKIDLTYFDSGNVTDMSSMFYYCSSLERIFADSDFSVAKVSSSTNMFYSCSNLKGGMGTEFSSTKNTAAYAHIDGGSSSEGYFTGKKQLKTGNEINLLLASPGIDISYKKEIIRSDSAPSDSVPESNIRYLDYGEENYPLWTTDDNAIIYYYTGNEAKLSLHPDSAKMFEGSGTIESIDLSGFDTSNVTDMSQMFETCKSLKELDLSGFNTSKVTDMTKMFYMPGVSELVTIYVSSGFNTSAVTASTEMFSYCTKLTGGAGTVYDAGVIDKTYARIDGGTGSPGYFTEK